MQWAPHTKNEKTKYEVYLSEISLLPAPFMYVERQQHGGRSQQKATFQIIVLPMQWVSLTRRRSVAVRGLEIFIKV